VSQAQILDPQRVIRPGMHMPVYVKDVFPNSGRFSVSMDASTNKRKVRPRVTSLETKFVFVQVPG
jgi:hypothetical protein